MEMYYVKSLNNNIFFINIMNHICDKNALEIKNEYTLRLSEILQPLIYYGIETLYNKSIKYYEELDKKRTDKSKPLSVELLFINFLEIIPKWNRDTIIKDTNRIRDASGCGEWFNKLIKSVVKSNIIFLTNGSLFKKENERLKNFHNDVDVNNFIHICYIHAGTKIKNEAFLFNSNISEQEVILNKRIIMKYIDESIQRAIWDILPISNILDEYLTKDEKEEQKNIRQLYNSKDNLLAISQIKNNESFLGGNNDGLSKFDETNKDIVKKTQPLINTINQNKKHEGGKYEGGKHEGGKHEGGKYEGGKYEEKKQNKSYKSDDDDDIGNAVINHIKSSDKNKKYQEKQMSSKTDVTTTEMTPLEDYTNSPVYKTLNIHQ